MDLPVKYDHIAPLAFGGTLPEAASFDNAKAVILPIPLESTTSYVNGTRNGPREILVASSHMELWDEELNTDVHGIGIYTLPEMELPFDDMGQLMAEIRRVVAAIVEHDKFPIVLGGEHSITSPVVAAMAAKHPGLSVLQIDAHADLRDCYMGTRWGENNPEDHVRYARIDLMGLVREDLLFDMARHVDSTVHQFEEWGLPIMKNPKTGRYMREGRWQIMIHGESYKPIVAEAAKKSADNLKQVRQSIHGVKLDSKRKEIKRFLDQLANRK